MSTIISDVAMSEARGGLLVERVRRFYSELIQSALGSIIRFRVLDPAVTHEDLAQEAVLRLISRSPSAWRAEAPALRVLKAWVKRCSWRLCADMSRRAKRRGPHSSLDGAEAGIGASSLTPSQPPSPLEELVARSQKAAVLRVLRAAYPRGAELLEHVLRQPGVCGDELAALMGVSRANVHQIRSRARRVVRRAGLGDTLATT